MNMPYASKRYDGFMNLFSGLGAPGLDRTVSNLGSGNFNSYGSNLSRLANLSYSAYDLTNLYMSNGLAQKIVDRPADDAFQRGVEVEEDADEVMCAEYDRLSVMTKMADAVRWSRLYGGGAILIIAKDGGELTDPLNLDTLDTVEELRVYDLQCIKATDRIYDDDSDPNTFGKVEYYYVIPFGSPAILVHETRLIPVASDPLPSSVMRLNHVYWAGRSALASCYDDIVRYGQGLEWSLRLLERKQQAVYQMEGLGQMFAQGDDSIVQKRINMVDMVRSVINSVVIDKNDEYKVMTAGMDGVKDMVEGYQTALAASANIPITILFGKSTTGLNNTGSGDLEAYYGMVSHIQRVIAKPPLERLTAILWVQKSLKGTAPEDWKIEFNPMWIPTAAEQAQTDFTEAQAINTEVTALIALMTNQIMEPEEIRKIVVDKFPEYEFSEELPVFPETDVSYAQGVDQSQMDVPGKTQGQRANATAT